MMNENSRYLLKLLAAFINDKAPPIPENRIDWQEVYTLSRKHYLSGATWLASSRLQLVYQPPEKIAAQFRVDFFNTLRRAANQDALLTRVYSAFDQQKITYIPLKGVVLRELYPVKEMRTLGDIDLLIHEEDAESAEQALKKIAGLTGIDDGHYILGSQLIELHKLINTSHLNSSGKVYFSGIWAHTYTTPGSYSLKVYPTFQLIYLLSHMAKHLSHNGCGIRMLLDIDVFIKKYQHLLDFNSLFIELHHIGLDVFARYVFTLCTRYLELPFQFSNEKVPTSQAETVMDYLLSSGTFGLQRSYVFELLRREYENTNCDAIAQLRVLIKKLFPDRIILQEQFPQLTQHTLFLPFAWMARGYAKRKKTARILRGLVNDAKEARESHAVMEWTGIKDIEKC